MRRRRVNRRDDGITLFPFLAVLICTMGSLIVLLVIVVQQARANAVNVSQQRESQLQNAHRKLEELQERKDEFEWRIDVLESSRQQTAEQLQDRRRELSYLEHEILELSKQLDRAVAEAERIAQLENSQVADQEASRQEVEQLRDAIRRSLEELELARQDLADRQRSYSIVPYKGAHGTERRPVFIECLADRIILQPEGIELTSRDFREPLTDENPLAAALRAKREYLARTLQSADGDPYPLLIVRPDGAGSYAAARAAMKSWDAEFGYELVESDIQLNYPEPDKLLVKALEYTVREARERRRHLQAIAPARFGRRAPTTFTASRTGGFVRRGGGPNRGPQQPPGSFEGSVSGRGNSPTGGNGSYPPANLADVAPSLGDGNGQANQGWGSEGQPGNFQEGSANGVANDQFAGDPFDPSRNGTGTGNGYRDGGQEAINGPFDPSSNERLGQSDWNSDSTRSAGGSGSAQASRGANRSTASARGSSANNSTASSNSSASGSSQSSAANGSSGIGGLSGGIAPPTAIAQARGAEWGLPERSDSATGITRPIQLVISSNRLEMLPEDQRFGRPTRLAIQGSMREEIDQLITVVWKRMDNWGIAGAGMYWKPILSVQVRPGAEARFQEFDALMKNSGLVVQRKQNRTR